MLSRQLFSDIVYLSRGRVQGILAVFFGAGIRCRGQFALVSWAYPLFISDAIE